MIKSEAINNEDRYVNGDDDERFLQYVYTED
jgi:hypothetical protein